MSAPSVHLIAVDVGNSRVKVGRFDRSPDCEAAALGGLLPIAGSALPEPAETLAFGTPQQADAIEQELQAWLTATDDALPQIVVASVNRSQSEAFRQRIERLVPDQAIEARELIGTQLPIEIRVDAPEKVGIDRLLAAMAANRLRHPGRPAVVVDLGTAITVDLIAGDGGFEGGAILPGIGMAARALNEQTDALPAHHMRELDDAPDAVGKSTDRAIQAGLFWGAVGAVREIIARQADRLTQSPHVFLTGGAAPSVGRLLAGPNYTVRFTPDLVLSGIALAADETNG